MKSAAGLCRSTLVSSTKCLRPLASLIGETIISPTPTSAHPLRRVCLPLLCRWVGHPCPTFRHALPAQIPAAVPREDVGREETGIAAEQETSRGKADWGIVGDL